MTTNTTINKIIKRLIEKSPFSESSDQIERDAVNLIILLWDFIERAKPIVECDAQMMADITRFFPLSPEDQIKHDTTEYPSEKWLDDLNRLGGQM